MNDNNLLENTSVSYLDSDISDHKIILANFKILGNEKTPKIVTFPNKEAAFDFSCELENNSEDLW